ncbi:MAG: hypothetical protein QM490_00385 [Candidatus Gracilibacteria bacterium]
MTIKKVLETQKVENNLKKYNILKQYLKAKNYILDGNTYIVDLKIRKPKISKIYYFRINKQYRAWGILQNEVLKIYKIDNHQN